MREENIAHRVVYSLKTDLNIEQPFFAKRLGQLPRSRGTPYLIPFQEIGNSRFFPRRHKLCSNRKASATKIYSIFNYTKGVTQKV